MKFDIKDIKTWANRHDVKAGDVGYVTCDFNTFLLTTKVALVTKATVKDIDDNDSRCFLAQPLDGKVVFHYGFFLPVDAVKEDKPKKKYRPFKTISELDYALNKGNRSAHQFMCVGNDIFIRNKKDKTQTHLLITEISTDPETREVLFINNVPPKTWFDNYEIRIGAGWKTFGIEVEDEH